MVVSLARSMQVPETDIIHYYRGALLHDIGKLGIPAAILHKPGPLDEAEWEIMQRHPIYAYQMLRSCTCLAPALDIPRNHHERWDGTGYPDGLAGEHIPRMARIFAVVDVWDALRSPRPFHTVWSETSVHNHLQDRSGNHFDPQVVDTFLALLTRPGRIYQQSVR
jgi:HD-GYP domain-containing protein (c-di-GMP phosphodiesterase class II)